MSGADRLPQILATLYSAPLHPEAWEKFLNQFAEAFQISKAALLAHDPAIQSHRMLAVHGASVKEATPSYEQYYWQFDEWTKRATRHNLHGKMTRGEAAWPTELMLRSTFYNEFLKPFDTCQMAGIGSFDADGSFSALSIYRGPSEPAFDNEVLSGLGALIPHLDTAFAVRRRLMGLEARATHMETALDVLPTGIAIVDKNGRCLFLNQKAREILKKRDGLIESHGLLTASRTAEANALRGLLARASGELNGTDRLSTLLRISRRKGCPLNVVVAPFPGDEAVGMSQHRMIILITDPDENPAGLMQALATLFRLTPAEARLAEALAAGGSLAEIAEQFQITLATVRTQLKSVLRKTETKRQSELMRLLQNIILPVTFE